jgi:hypothetical protein
MSAATRPALLPAHRHWILANALIATADINLVVNAVLGFGSAHGHGHIPTWSTAVSPPSILSDSLGVLFFLPVITCLLVSAGVRAEQRADGLPPITSTPRGRWWDVVMVPRPLARAARLGAATFVVLAVPVGLAIRFALPNGLAGHNFAIFHVLYTTALGAIITPLIAYAAMLDPIPDVASS